MGRAKSQPVEKYCPENGKILRDQKRALRNHKPPPN
jgi:hypothetical protein